MPSLSFIFWSQIFVKFLSFIFYLSFFRSFTTRRIKKKKWHLRSPCTRLLILLLQRYVKRRYIAFIVSKLYSPFYPVSYVYQRHSRKYFTWIYTLYSTQMSSLVTELPSTTKLSKDDSYRRKSLTKSWRWIYPELTSLIHSFK